MQKKQATNLYSTSALSGRFGNLHKPLQHHNTKVVFVFALLEFFLLFFIVESSVDLVNLQLCVFCIAKLQTMPKFSSACMLLFVRKFF